ncbi:MAG TPA: CBS domain-containing protein [Burkholderiales bacterium]|nr:CBS domain-containing protein [Burkholderiales bacterium]
MRIKEIMAQPVVTAREQTSLEEIAALMLQHHVGCVPVVDGRGQLCGIITESDFAAKEKGVPFSTFRAPQVLGKWLTEKGIERLYEQARKMTASEIMNTNVIALAEDEPIERAVELMLKHDINRIPVLRARVPVGIVSRHDLLKLLLRKQP